MSTDTDTDRVPFVALLGTIGYHVGGQVATANCGETLLLDAQQAGRLLELGAVRPWQLGDAEPVEAELRLGLPPAPPVGPDEAPRVSPAPVSDAEAKLRALYGDDDADAHLGQGLAAFYAQRARQAEEDAAQRRQFQPWQPEHAEQKRRLLLEWEAERRVQQREADDADRRSAEIRAEHQQAVEAELESMTTLEAS